MNLELILLIIPKSLLYVYRYAELMKQLFEENFFYLIDTVEYDQAKYCRHPRSVPVDEITALFGSVY